MNAVASNSSKCCRIGLRRQLGKTGSNYDYFNCGKNNVRLLSSMPSASDTATATATAGVPYSLWMWGTNEKGSIPSPEVLKEGKDSSASPSSSSLLKSKRMYDHPVPIDLQEAYNVDNSSTMVKSVVCGPKNTAMVLTDGRCFLVGDNSSGQLGNGGTSDVLAPQLLDPPDSSPLHIDQVESIALGSHFSAVIDTNGDLYTFGYGGSVMKEGVGNLGHGDANSYHTPKLVSSLVEDGVYAQQVALGNAHMTVLTTEGEVLTAGAGSYGRCGNLETVDQLYLEPIELLQSENIQQVAAGKAFSVALTQDGVVYCWGKNDSGQCGSGAGFSVDVYAMEPIPMPVEGFLEGRRVVKVDAGHSHTAAVTDQGELFIWGNKLYHQPELMTNVHGVIDVSCGKDYTIALDDQGRVHSFGKGKTGVLGLGAQTSLSQPSLVEGLSQHKVAQISAGWSHVAALVQPK